ncbi:hypothetical protein [Erythrobacter sp. SG61-1L]|uniref:hypothetical protein n=1 Tax=Erythrobacter sp. SG61-1L TaxID=1603897 RepID=UPI0012E276E5|nr:hypothetical protein [Erythrobacter sp. SG61-1L]
MKLRKATALSAIIIAAAGITTAADAQTREKIGLPVTTPTGSGILFSFSLIGPADDVEIIKNRMAELGCPPPLVRDAGSEKKIFAPFSNRCDESEAVIFLQDIQSGKFPRTHSLDVQYFPAEQGK